MLRATFSTALALASFTQATRVAPRDQTMRTSSTDPSVSQYMGNVGQTTTIASGVTYWLSGGISHQINGNVNNYGSIYMSQTDYLKLFPLAGGQTCNWAGHDTLNGNLVNAVGGLIQLNDIGSISGPTYNWNLRNISNAGTIQWCGRGDTGGSTYQLYSDLDAINTGLISYEQVTDNDGAAFFWRNTILTTGSSLGNNLYNNGAFRLVNVVFHSVQNVYGTGCWQLGVGSTLYLEDGSGINQNPGFGPTFPGQSIAFTDSSSALHLDYQSYSHNSSFGPQIYGFGTGNAIEFAEIITSYSYSATAGVLTVKTISGSTCNLKIGTGYTASKFSNQLHYSKYNVLGYNSIFYSGAAPSSSAPATCSLTAPVCKNLGSYPPNGTGSSTSSSSSSSTSSTSTGTTKTSTTTGTTSTSTSSISSTTTPPSIPATPTSTSTTSTSSTISAIPSASYTGTCAYQGCYTEGANGRALDTYTRLVSSNMTVEICDSYCRQFPSQFFGVEYGTECYCGNVLEYGSVKASESDCNFVCPGNSGETCGAGNRLNVYACGTATASSYPTTTAQPSCTTVATSISTITQTASACTATATVTVTQTA